jgi:hypothetical protein
MPDHITRQDIEAARAFYWGGAVLSPQELEELLADLPNPCPMVALCDRHNWRRPSSADYAFIEACDNRLQLRLQQAIQPPT